MKTVKNSVFLISALITSQIIHSYSRKVFIELAPILSVCKIIMLI